MDLAIESGMCAAAAANVALRDENMERMLVYMNVKSKILGCIKT